MLLRHKEQPISGSLSPEGIKQSINIKKYIYRSVWWLLNTLLSLGLRGRLIFFVQRWWLSWSFFLKEQLHFPPDSKDYYFWETMDWCISEAALSHSGVGAEVGLAMKAGCLRLPHHQQVHWLGSGLRRSGLACKGGRCLPGFPRLYLFLPHSQPWNPEYPHRLQSFPRVLGDVEMYAIMR